MGKRERMSRKLDSWLGRGFKSYKLKSLLGLTLSRLAVLRNQRRSRFDHALADVAELLRLGHHERALLRAEYVIKEQNMLDAFAMVESYCHVLTERAALLENQEGCPDELREAISGLLFAASRCGELPELHEVRSILTSRLGKEFVAAAVELRNNCGVNTRIIQKLSTKQASLESRQKVAKEIAAEIGVVLQLEEPSSELPTPVTPKQPTPRTDDVSGLGRDEYLSESMKMRQRYKDAVSAAQAAFESAAYAAAAARAAVELSRTESQGKGGPGDQNSPHAPARTTSSDRRHPVQSSSSGSESEQGMRQGDKTRQDSAEGKYSFPAASTRGDLLQVTDKKMAYETSEGGGGGGGGEAFKGSPSGPVQSRAPESPDRSGDGFQGHRQLGVSSDEDTYDEEGEEQGEKIKPQTATFGWGSPAGRQGNWERSRRKAGMGYSKLEEEQEEEEEELLKSSSPARVEAASSPVNNRLRMGRGCVTSRRTKEKRILPVEPKFGAKEESGGRAQ